jgi:isoquinoline 1-oxidoreductase beta subunit
MNDVSQLNRRSFFVGAAAVGGGLMLGLDIPLGGPEAVCAEDGAREINAWVVIKPDDTVVIRIARSEMGQGTQTGLAQLVAEELACDWSKVTTEFPTPGQSVARKRVWGDFSTGGRRGIRESHEYVRKGGAVARTMLVQAAANEWKVPASECSAADSVITHTGSGRTTTFGKVAEAAAKLEPPTDVKLKDPKDWKLAGKGVKRLDTADKVIGKTQYGIDIKLPGMLNAAIKDCPVFGGKLQSFDEAKVTGMQGVKKVVKFGESDVEIIADTWWKPNRARYAADRMDNGPTPRSSASIAEILKAGLDAEQASWVIRAATSRPPSPARPRRSRPSAIPTRPRLHGADERYGSSLPTNARSGRAPRTVRRICRRGRLPGCPPPNVRFTKPHWAAASAVAAEAIT